MGRLLDDLNRLSATAAQGNILNRGNKSARAQPEEPGHVTKAKLVARHPSCDFVAKHYEVVRELGRGSFSTVKLVRDKRTGHERVCKVVSTEQMTPQVLDLTRTEIQVLATLDHPSIVKLYEYADDAVNKKLVLILEYISGGDCSDLLEESGRTLNEGRVARLLQQLLIAVNYCHSRGIVHRDIKPQNMMLTRSSGAWGNPNLKIIDFGLAVQRGRSRDFVGTPAYMPPEVLAGNVDHTFKADMWSIACTAIELLAGEPPFGKPEDFESDMAPVFDGIRSFEDFDEVDSALDELPSWSGRSAEAKDFVQCLLQVDPSKRPTALEALSHPWMERNRAAKSGLTVDMMRSMAEFAAAPELLRCCLMLLAARTGLSEDARVGAAFADLDEDCDGGVSQEELLDALVNVTSCGWSRTDVDAGTIFGAIDLRQSGKLSFTEFAAACLFGRHGKNLDKLAEQAFMALDDDRDGWVGVEEVRRCLSRGAASSAAGLLHDRPISAYEWRSCIRAIVAQAAPPPAPAGASALCAAEEESPQPLLAFFNAFLCEQLLCNSCEQCRDVDDEKNGSDSPVVLRHSFDPNTELPVAGYELPDVRRSGGYEVPEIVQKPYHVQVV